MLEVLFQCKTLIANHHGDLLGYLGWAMDTARLLRNRIRSSDIDRLIFTSRFWRLQGLAEQIDRFARDLLDMEITDRAEALEQAWTALNSEINRWGRADAELAVVDTTVFIRHPAKIREIEYAHELGLGFEPVRLVVPRVVVDELDRLKESGNQQVRWRAGHTLGVLDELLRAPRSRVTIREADNFSVVADAGGMPRDKVTIEVLFDDPNHVRLDDNDDEIIDRTLALQTYAGQRVLLLTMDTSMALRARMRDLQVRKITKDIGPEPTAPEPKPARK